MSLCCCCCAGCCSITVIMGTTWGGVIFCCMLLPNFRWYHRGSRAPVHPILEPPSPDPGPSPSPRGASPPAARPPAKFALVLNPPTAPDEDRVAIAVAIKATRK